MDDLKDGVDIRERFKKLWRAGQSEEDMWTKYGKTSLTTRHGDRKLEREN